MTTMRRMIKKKNSRDWWAEAHPTLILVGRAHPTI